MYLRQYLVFAIIWHRFLIQDRIASVVLLFYVKVEIVKLPPCLFTWKENYSHHKVKTAVDCATHRFNPTSKPTTQNSIMYRYSNKMLDYLRFNAEETANQKGTCSSRHPTLFIAATVASCGIGNIELTCGHNFFTFPFSKQRLSVL